MMHLLRSIGAAGLVSCAYATPVFGGDVAKLDPALDKLIDPDAKVEIVKGGFGFTEGPVWVQKGKTGYLLFSDIPANVIYKLAPAGEASVYLDHSGYTKPDIWRVGFEFNNGRDPNDPSFAKF
jgi:gluconolactonase